MVHVIRIRGSYKETYETNMFELDIHGQSMVVYSLRMHFERLFVCCFLSEYDSLDILKSSALMKPVFEKYITSH